MANTDTTSKKTRRPSKFYPEGQKARGSSTATGIPSPNATTTAANNGRLYGAGRALGEFTKNALTELGALGNVAPLIAAGSLPATLGAAYADAAAGRYDNPDNIVTLPNGQKTTLKESIIGDIRDAAKFNIHQVGEDQFYDQDTGEQYDEAGLRVAINAKKANMDRIQKQDPMYAQEGRRALDEVGWSNIPTSYPVPATGSGTEVATYVEGKSAPQPTVTNSIAKAPAPTPVSTPAVQTTKSVKSTTANDGVIIPKVDMNNMPNTGSSGSFNWNDLMPLLALAATGYAGYKLGR